jgi:TRAP-type C4-dicarboxylate transport system substrate-binding protein
MDGPPARTLKMEAKGVKAFAWRRRGFRNMMSNARSPRRTLKGQTIRVQERPPISLMKALGQPMPMPTSSHLP